MSTWADDPACAPGPFLTSLYGQVLVATVVCSGHLREQTLLAQRGRARIEERRAGIEQA